jgi:hypothetical protein
VNFPWAAAFQPVVRAPIKQDNVAFAGRTQPARAMGGRTAFSGRADSGTAQQATQGFAAEGKAFLFGELFTQMMIVKAGIGVRAGAGCGRARAGVGGDGWPARDWREPAPLRRLADSALRDA